jgi:hypothetical protein
MPPKVTYPNRESPQGLIDTFATSLEDKSLGKYDDCLWGSYRFVFMEEDWDAAGVTPDEPYWGKTEDMSRTGKMFASSHVLGISFEMTNVSDFVGPDTLLAVLCRPTIDVTITGPGGEEPVTKQVRKSYLYFVLRPDPYDEDLWVIREIQEQLILAEARHALATESSTFGEIKAIFK